ncbi:polysaccharide deacetylase family protein [Deinococcus fonticola]|uniref:polysaccharide deacetylase family protein n=1 Tax=Deinococcus fonticola TaxID=2528713 RepID=UPI001F0DF33B|nr:polysaccharide deacetylase family protein [Deinococcus fonticola]
MSAGRWRAVTAGLLGVTVLSAVLGEVLGRAMGWGALGGGPGSEPNVAVTFDDGPSERTHELLDVLREFGVQATFFVTQPACRAFPAELQATVQAGHQVEAHGRWHTHALLLQPWREWAQVRWHPRIQELRAQEPGFLVTGPLLYRPPYGGHSPFTRLLARLHRRQIALWDVEGRDWLNQSAEILAAQTLAQMRPGSVVLLHDGPQVTPELLRLVLSGLHARGLRAVTLHELRPQRLTWRAGLKRLRRSYGR